MRARACDHKSVHSHAARSTSTVIITVPRPCLACAALCCLCGSVLTTLGFYARRRMKARGVPAIIRCTSIARINIHTLTDTPTHTSVRRHPPGLRSPRKAGSPRARRVTPPASTSEPVIRSGAGPPGLCAPMRSSAMRGFSMHLAFLSFSMHRAWAGDLRDHTAARCQERPYLTVTLRQVFVHLKWLAPSAPCIHNTYSTYFTYTHAYHASLYCELCCEQNRLRDYRATLRLCRRERANHASLRDLYATREVDSDGLAPHNTYTHTHRHNCQPGRRRYVPSRRRYGPRAARPCEPCPRAPGIRHTDSAPGIRHTDMQS